MTTDLILPRRKRGRPSADARRLHDEQMEAFADAISEIASRLDFDMSARGWGYYLEGQGTITKGDIDLVEKTINDCRKLGLLPIDITAEDSKREWINVQWIDDDDVEDKAKLVLNYIETAHKSYTPFSFWDDQEFYLQMLVEKTDLKSLFGRVCGSFYIPIANAGGWGDLHVRAEMMERFAEKEAEGKKCVLLYFGDFDPGGVLISGRLRANLFDLAVVTGYDPTDLIIDRFGLDQTYIEDHGLVWIDNLITGSGMNLADPKHPNFKEAWVQDWLRDVGERKVEANALLADPVAGRELCRQAILRYLPEDSPQDYRDSLEPKREELRLQIIESLREREEEE